MKLKKLFSVVLTFLLCFSFVSAVGSAEEIENDSDFLDTPTLPTVEEVEVSVVYRPLKSLVSFAGFGPLFDGTVLKVTYPDGSSETVTLETNWTGLSDYVAGDFNVYTSYFDTMNVKSPGINKQRIVLNGVKDDVEYDGVCSLDYLYIPSFGEIFYLIDSLVRIHF